MVGYKAVQIKKRVMEVIEETKAQKGEGAKVASQPIVSTTNTLTRKDVQKRAREFRVRQWVDGYKTRSRHDSPCDSESLRMLEAGVARSQAGARRAGSGK